MSSLLLIFIDGLGIGTRDPAVNPLAAFEPKLLRIYEESSGPFPRGGTCLVTDAQLGVEGLPQSATGQTTLLTGVNASAYLGRHLHGFPNPALKELIQEKSLFRHLQKKGCRVTFANTYTPRFFAERPRRVSVSTVMCETADVELWKVDDLLANRSLYMDFTNRVLRDRGLDVPLRTPPEAAEILVNLTKEYEFCLYEYFLTDIVGHRGTLEEAVGLLSAVDEFLFQVVNRLDLETTSLVISSDHGNVESMDHKQHTTNPVPTLLWGRIQELADACEDFSLMDVAPLIEQFIERKA